MYLETFYIKFNMQNILIQGDNIDGLRYLLDTKGLSGKIDLVYIDPPFATNNNFTVSEDRISTISSSKNGKIAYEDKITGKKFIEYLRERLILLYELLSERGSIYLHTDYKIGHYIKVMMDEIFGINNFRNDITRVKCNPKNFARIGYGNIKDMILFYTKTNDAIWNEPKQPYTEKDIFNLFPKIDKKGRRYTTVPIHAPGESDSPKKFKNLLPPKGRHWRTDVETLEAWDKEGLIEWSSKGNPRKIVYADTKEGKRMQDIWTDYKDPQYPVYPTEKNIDFIDMIIKTSSNVGSVVLDCFCGSGTTLLSAQRNNRYWIGVDKSSVAIKTTKQKLGLNDNILFNQDTEFISLDENLNNEIVALK